MKRLFLLSLFAILLFSFKSDNITPNFDDDNISYKELRSTFVSPPDVSGLNCWWWWINSNVTKEAIKHDLEEMKAKGFQGATVIDASGHNNRGNKDIPAGPLYGSKEWIDLFVYALDVAKELDLEIGFSIVSGWNLGGPSVAPEDESKLLTSTETTVKGGKTINQKLQQPRMRKNFYRDIAVVAYPISKNAISDQLITSLSHKFAEKELGMSAPDCSFLLENDDTQSANLHGYNSYVIDASKVIDITSYMDSEGNLKWKAPKGEWGILRVGYTCASVAIKNTSGDWHGYALDHMSKKAFDNYSKIVVDPILEAAGDHVGNTLKYMETDSWESGGTNWTEGFRESFADYNGYDIIKYFPVMAGHIMGDIDNTNAFLADVRKTVAHLIATNHYEHFQKYAHKHNMGVFPESAGPHTGPFDGIKNYGYSDIVMSEFWSPSPHRPDYQSRFFVKQASSAAHIYGKKIVGAESFTTIGTHWDDELWSAQKSAFDHEICSGLNRVYFHTFTCSPKEYGLPGNDYFAGTHINTRLTWWDEADGFFDYMHRTQHVVQNGKFFADVLYFYGDNIPNIYPLKEADKAGAMPGYDYDVTDETIFLQLEYRDGKVVVPTGISYNVLVLPQHKALSMAVLKKTEELLSAGAHIVGSKPDKLISLVGGDEDKELFNSMIDQIWGENPAEKGVKTYGKGEIAWGMSSRDYLQSKGIAPDCNVDAPMGDYDYIHYTIDGVDFYFISNQTAKSQTFNVSLRSARQNIEIWQPLDGSIRKVEAFTQKDGITTLPLTLEPHESIFVVLDGDAVTSKKGEKITNSNIYTPIQTIDGSWRVDFDPKWGAPASVEFETLTDWSENSDEGIKYYSGKAIYNKKFNFDGDLSQKYSLSLGSVKDVGIAVVKINGKDKGIVWTPPFRVDITDDLVSGENILEITVVNSWYNRVLGDQLHPDKEQFTQTNIVLTNDYTGKPAKEHKLQPSGLMGPVVIEKY